LPHLDSLLGIEDLDGIQWVPGEGQPNCGHWPEVYQKIHAAGKKIQVIDNDFGSLRAVIGQIGTDRGVHKYTIRKSIDEEDAVRRRLDKYAVE